MSEALRPNITKEILDWVVLCSVLRKGPVSGENAVLALAVLIYLRWVDFQEAELEAIASFDDTVYEPILTRPLHWSSWCELPPSELAKVLRRDLPKAISNLGYEGNPLTINLQRISGSLEVTGRFSPKDLATIVHWLRTQPFETPSDRKKLLGAFDRVLNEFSDKVIGGLRTPPQLERLIAELAAPSVGERVYDPCFGSAGLLTAACDLVVGQENEGFSPYSGPILSISGVERNQQSFIIGLTRLVLAGIDDPKLELGNSLERETSANSQRDGFDVIVSNPPWNSRANSKEVAHFPVQTNDSTGLFIQHALSQLRPNGRAVILVPEGFLFRGGQEKKLRKMLVDQHTVEAIISLPPGLFMPYSGIKTTLLVFRRGGATKRIRMMDTEPFFEKNKAKMKIAIGHDVSKQLAEKFMAAQPSENCWDIDVKTLADIDWDFTVRRRDKNSLLSIIGSLKREWDVVTLQECCTITSGHAICSDDLLKMPTGEQPIPYVRIKDLRDNQILKGTSWLSPAARVSNEDIRKISEGDVLLSKSGTIGKAGLVTKEMAGAIPASGFFVLRPNQDQLYPHFLFAWLDSSECRAWLNDKTQGTYINHLSKRILEKLPIPIPPLLIQMAAVVEHRSHGGDFITYLTTWLTGGKTDPIIQWVEKALKKLPEELSAINDPLDLLWLDRFAKSFSDLKIEPETQKGIDRPLKGWIWLFAFGKAMSPLVGLNNVPSGPALLTILREVVRELEIATDSIEGKLAIESKVGDLIQILINRVRQASLALLTNIKLVPTVKTNTLRIGDMVELELQIRNESPLPIREVIIITEPDWGSAKLIYISENSNVAITLKGTTPKLPGSFTLTVKWLGSRLDGELVEGSRELAFNIADVADTASSNLERTIELGGSPYICGGPVLQERNDVFLGREDLIDQIRRQIVQSGNVVLLEGNRRAGKTSILRHLEGTNAVPGWLGSYCSLGDAEGNSESAGVRTVDVFRGMANNIARSLRALGDETPLPDGTKLPPGQKLGIAEACMKGIGEGSPFSDFREYAEIALDLLKSRNLGLLLMLDEFDKLQEGIDNGITSPQVPENIRFLVQTYPKFSAILTGSIRLKRLREEYWSALFGLGTIFSVTSLSLDASKRLVTDPVKNRLTYSGEAIDRIVYLAARQPYLLQSICNRIFDLATQLKTKSVTLDLVEKAANVLVDPFEHFAFLWNYLRTERRRLILTLCHRESTRQESLNFGIIRELLIQNGVEVPDESLFEDLEEMRELELITFKGESKGGCYEPTIPLMGMWIEKHQDFATLKIKARNETEDQYA